MPTSLAKKPVSSCKLDKIGKGENTQMHLNINSTCIEEHSYFAYFWISGRLSFACLGEHYTKIPLNLTLFSHFALL